METCQIMAFTKDHLPLCGEIEKNIYFVGGFNGHGQSFAFELTKQLVDHIHTEKMLAPTFDIKRVL